MFMKVLQSLTRLMLKEYRASIEKTKMRCSSQEDTSDSFRTQHPSLTKFVTSNCSMDHFSIVDDLLYETHQRNPIFKKFNSESQGALLGQSCCTSHDVMRSSKAKIARLLEFFSSACAVAGGSLLASNIDQSKYGFIILALSSCQMLIASILNWQKNLIIYAASVFCFVDCLGIVRWVLQ
jgi:hypothetical protein